MSGAAADLDVAKFFVGIGLCREPAVFGVRAFSEMFQTCEARHFHLSVGRFFDLAMTIFPDKGGAAAAQYFRILGEALSQGHLISSGIPA